MLFALVAGLTAVCIGSVQGQAWKTWETCKLQSTEAESHTASSFSSERELAETLDREDLRQAHQLIYINNNTGKLEVNHNATVWNELISVHQEVNVIVLYGKSGQGSSTLASILGCAMNKADEETTLFPAAKADQDLHTVGVWASDPFSYSGPDGTGETKYYMIMDIQGIEQTDLMLPGLSNKLYNDAGIKMIAMLTEVASEFIYMIGDSADKMNSGDYDDMGLAFRSTRENLVKTGEDFITNAEEKINIRSVNQPGLLVLTREGEGRDIVAPDNLVLNEKYWDKKTYDSYTDKTDDVLKKLLKENFKNHTVTHNEKDEVVAWYFNPVPNMDDRIEGDIQFQWGKNSFPFSLEKGAACRAYKQMNTAAWQCKKSGGDNKLTPAAPPTYKVMIDNLANYIHEHAPVRKVAWGAQDAAAEDLTGRRLKGFLEAGVEEINKAGVVADNELWRLIAEDRCEADLNSQISRYYQGKYDTINEQANEVRTGLTETPPIKEDKIGIVNSSIIATWQTAAYQFDLKVDDYFHTNPLLESVREDCVVKATSTFAKLNLKAEKLFKEMKYLGQKAVSNRLEEENSKLKDEIERLQKQVDKLWWEKNLPYFAALAVIGLIVLFMLTRMFGMVCGTCRSCIDAADDLQTKDTQRNFIVVNKGGVEMSQAPPIPGLVAPAATAMSNGANPQIQQRIRELEAVVLQLEAKLPKSELDKDKMQSMA